MKFLFPILLLLPLLSAAPAAEAARPGSGQRTFVADNGPDRRSGADTVVITGRDGRVTGVERRPGDGDRNRERDKDRDRNRRSPASDGAGGRR